MDPIALEAQESLGKSIDAFKDALSRLRSGRANPAMLNGIKCDYYGEKMDISNLCSISLPEPRQLLVKPYNREDLKTVAAAIHAANIGLNPQVEADVIRIIVPALTEEIRKQIAKQAKGLADEAKVSVRNVRREYMELIKEDDSMSDDYKDRVEEDVQKFVDEANKQIDVILAEKQKEIMTI
ncbi:MAG: ribosome recycling factor [Bacilli bacterium]|nr:ribosome recycling factor [Bacilli bacterium]